MLCRGTWIAAVVLGGLALAGPVSASADDQAVADAAIEAFNERLTEAGAESSGPPDTTPEDPEEFAEENPGAECFGDFALAFDPGGEVAGETGRADSDHFSYRGETGSDEIDAGVVVFDEERADALDGFVETLGSDDLASCLETAFTTLLEEQIAAAEESSGTTTADTATFEVATESDIGVGDSSAHLQLVSTVSYDGSPYVSVLDLYVATVGRSLAAITVATGDEPASDFDAVAELEALVEAL